MGEDGKLFIGQGLKIMVGDKPVGFAEGGMLTCQVEDDASTKDSGWLEHTMHHSYEVTGKAVVPYMSDPIRELLDMPSKVDVEIRREMGKMPRKMKKAYRTGSRYRRDTKQKRKAKAYESRYIYRLPNAEMVVTHVRFGALEATIKGSELQYNPDAHISGKEIDKALSAFIKRSD